MKVTFKPKVSIIIPVYNGSDYMRDAIDSALAQTYSNIEVLVINDGSNDNGETDKIAKSYGDRIRYFFKPNGGVATALNLGIEKMEGEYFSWLSHDDVYMPDKVQAQVDLVSNLDNYETVIYSGYNLMDETGKIYACIDFLKLYNQKKLDTPLFNVLKGLANGCTMLIPKKHFEMYGVFDPNLPTTQDYELWFQMFRNVPIKYSSVINVNMRQHANQGSKIIDSHVKEGNELWISFLKRITIEEMCRIDETPELFLERTENFLAQTSYMDAHSYCCELLEKGVDYNSINNKNLVKLLCCNYNEQYKELQNFGNFAGENKDSIIIKVVNCVKDKGIIYTINKIIKKIISKDKW